MFGIAPFAGAPYASLAGVTIVVALTGVQATGNVGAEVATQVLSGVASSGAVGTVSVAERLIALTGVSSTGNVDSPTGGQPITGVGASGAVGNVIAIYWRLIDDSQSANWQNITDSQTVTWVLVNTDTPTTWNLFDTTP